MRLECLLRRSLCAICLASTVGAVETFGQVMGYTSFTCNNEIAIEFASVADACASYDVNAYRVPSQGIYECTVCSTDPVGPPPPQPPIIIIVGPPASCPAGQHPAEGGGCEDDHECGDDEIGGGSEECEKCGYGEVPNEDGTDCVDCEHGEYEPGECAVQCSNHSLDWVVPWNLNPIPSEPWERLQSYTCMDIGNSPFAAVLSETVGNSQFYDDVCEIEVSGYSYPSAYGHSHPLDSRSSNVYIAAQLGRAKAHIRGLSPNRGIPSDLLAIRYRRFAGEPFRWTESRALNGIGYCFETPLFEWDRDKGVVCLDEEIESSADVRALNRSNKNFSGNDKTTAKTLGKPLYLIVPLRDMIKVYRKTGNKWKVEEL